MGAQCSLHAPVRREGARFSAGVIPARQLVAPAGSNRSGGGGNDTVEAFEATGSLGDPASMQAVTQVNAEQASKQAMWEPTRSERGEGRRCDSSRLPARVGWEHERYELRSLTGVVATACMHKETSATREAPAVRARDPQPKACPNGQAGRAAWGDGEVRSSDETG